jgi:hypothetical protein
MKEDKFGIKDANKYGTKPNRPSENVYSPYLTHRTTNSETM